MSARSARTWQTGPLRGKKPSTIERTTGEVREVELFVATLGASNYTYGEATETQQSRDFIASNIHSEYQSDVPGALVPDQLNSAVGRRAVTSRKSSAPVLIEFPRTAVLPPITSGTSVWP